MIKNLLILICSLILVFLILPENTYSAYLKFDKETHDASVGDQFDVQVIIDTEGEEVVSSDVYIPFDSTVFEVVSISPGDFFDTVSHDVSTEEIYIAGMMEDIGVGKRGTGLIATITLRVKGGGRQVLSFLCDTSSSRTSTINKQVGVEVENIINCSSNKSLTVKIAGTDADQGEETDSSYSDTTDSQGTTSDTAPSQLPKSGIFDNTINLVFWGGGFLVIGFLIKSLFL